MPSSAQAIYDRLAADAVVSAALGVYVLPTGATLPAISVLAANETLPAGTAAGGIEVVITRIPGYAPRALLTAETLLNPTWRVTVLAWDSLANLQPVVERIIALLPGATATTIPGDAPGEGIGVLDQVVITWTNPTAMVVSP